VFYKIDGFLDKNTQHISVDAELVLTTSEHPLFATLFPDIESKKKGDKKRYLDSFIHTSCLIALAFVLKLNLFQFWNLVFGFWFLVFGFWFLVFGVWSFVS
jgi:hypothetical protein